MSTQWIETYVLPPGSPQLCGACGQPARYLRYYPSYWPWSGKPAHPYLCDECKRREETK